MSKTPFNILPFALCLLLSSASSFAQVGTSFKNFYHTQFSQYFHTQELKRTPGKNGEQRTIKTGGFQEQVTIYIYTDTTPSLMIHGAELVMDSEWVHNADYVEKVRALVGHFLEDFVCREDELKLRPAAQLIFSRKQTRDKLALTLNDVFIGKKTSYSEKLGKCTVRMENVSQGEDSYLRVKISD